MPRDVDAFASVVDLLWMLHVAAVRSSSQNCINRFATLLSSHVQSLPRGRNLHHMRTTCVSILFPTLVVWAASGVGSSSCPRWQYACILCCDIVASGTTSGQRFSRLRHVFLMSLSLHPSFWRGQTKIVQMWLAQKELFFCYTT